MRRVKSIFPTELVVPMALGLVFWSFIVFAWHVFNRIHFPVLVLTVVVGWFALERILGCLRFVFRGRRPILHSISYVVEISCVIVLAYGAFPHWAAKMPTDLEKHHHHLSRRAQHWVALGEHLRQQDPEPIVMTRDPWELHHFSGVKAVQIPNASLGAILAVAQHFGVTHIYYDRRRPGLKQVLKGEVPGIEVEFGRPPSPLFRLDWDLIDPDLIAELGPELN